MKFSKSESTVTVLFSDLYDNAVVQIADPELYEALDPIFSRILSAPDTSPGVLAKLEALVHKQCELRGLV